MPNPVEIHTVGSHRPVYLWAGQATVRMNRLKFMNAPVDEAVHLEAHTPQAANRMASEAGFNWAYLMYDWGFPPEIAAADWQDFRQAVQVYRAAGVRTFGYVQTSNCAYQGSHQGQDWYARDPAGRPIYYYTGRYMTCWLHPAWRTRLQEIVSGIVAAGADGVFFDNPWHAHQPLHLSGAWIGPAGCYCPRCRAAFKSSSGYEIPPSIQPEDDTASQAYVRWRAGVVTETLAGLAALARQQNPQIIISANDFDCVMRPSHLIYGIDLPALAQVQDILMIEDYGLPRYQPAVADQPALLVNNALTLHTARALSGAAALTTDPYDKGIGFDGVYPGRRFQQGIAEAAACGAPMVVKGTEFVEDGAFTLLTAARYAPQRQAIGALHRWLEAQVHLYAAPRRNAARLGLLYPGDALWQRWDQVAPLYFGAGQALIAAGLPWRVVANPADCAGLDCLLTCTPLPTAWNLPASLKVLPLPSLPGWETPSPSALAQNPRLRRLVSSLLTWAYRAYFEKRWGRWLGDRLGLVHLFLQSPYYRLPAPAAQASLEAALRQQLGAFPAPQVSAAQPVLIETWQRGAQTQIHLVNYAAQPQPVKLSLPQPAPRVQLLTPDSPPRQLTGATLEFDLAVYAVLLLEADAG